MKLRPMTFVDACYADNHSISHGIASKEPPISDLSVTLEDDGKIMAVGGVRLINLTTAWCWVNLTHDAVKNIISVYREITEWLDEITKEHNIKRLQAYVDVDFPEGIKLLEHLKFTKESVMDKFSGDKDAFMYKRITWAD